MLDKNSRTCAAPCTTRSTPCAGCASLVRTATNRNAVRPRAISPVRMKPAEMIVSFTEKTVTMNRTRPMTLANGTVSPRAIFSANIRSQAAA